MSECMSSPRDELLSILPDGCITNGVHAKISFATIPEWTDTILAVVLQVCQRCIDGKCGAGSETIQGEVVM